MNFLVFFLAPLLFFWLDPPKRNNVGHSQGPCPLVSQAEPPFSIISSWGETFGHHYVILLRCRRRHPSSQIEPFRHGVFVVHLWQ